MSKLSIGQGESNVVIGQVESNVIRQGDVLLTKVTELPEGARLVEPRKGEGKILQSSETHGKHHHFHGNAAVDIHETRTEPSEEGTITPDFGKFIVVREDSELFHGKGFHSVPNMKSHTDHHSIPVPTGLYRVDIIREMDYTTGVVRKVID